MTYFYTFRDVLKCSAITFAIGVILTSLAFSYLQTTSSNEHAPIAAQASMGFAPVPPMVVKEIDTVEVESTRGFQILSRRIENLSNRLWETEANPTALSDDNLRMLMLVVYTESGNLTTEYEWQLIMESFLYNYWRYTKGSMSFRSYLEKYPKHFQGWYNRDRFYFAEAMMKLDPSTVDKYTSAKYGWVSNRDRLIRIREVIVDRLENGAPRYIRHYHHDKVDFAYLDGKKVPLNKNHISKVREMADEGELNLVNDGKMKLYHDFYEEPTPDVDYNEFRNAIRLNPILAIKNVD